MPAQAVAQLRQDPAPAAEAIYIAIYIDTQAGGRRLLFELGPAAQIDAQVRAHREMLSLHPRRRTAGQPQALTVAAEHLHKALVAPVEPLLRDCTTLIIVPDGALWHLSWAALPAREGRPLLEKLEIRYLTSARDLVRRRADLRSASHAAVVIADPDFDLASAQPLAGNSGPEGEIQFVDRTKGADEQAGNDLRAKNRAFHAERLPGTRVEGASVAGSPFPDKRARWRRRGFRFVPLRAAAHPARLQGITQRQTKESPYRPLRIEHAGSRAGADLVAALEVDVHQHGLARNACRLQAGRGLG